METKKGSGIGFFEKYLTVWVILCMVVGVLIGQFLPAIPAFLGRFTKPIVGSRCAATTARIEWFK